jgi:CRP/FNR family transcriptional regulator, cyclic AMP receptor protein
MDQAFQLFSECWLFRNFERREKEELFTHIKNRDFAAGETICVIGSPGDSGMIVLHGTVRISVTSPKGPRPHVLAILPSGELFGEIALLILDGKERLADVITITGCSLAVLNRHDLLAFLEQNPGAWQKIVSVLCERFRHASRRPRAIVMPPLPVPA